VLAVVLGTALAAGAATGVVAFKKSGCDYFVVNSAAGLALLKWHEGYFPEPGDVVDGNFETYGFQDLHTFPTAARSRVWVEAYGLSTDAVVQQLRRHCI